MSEREQPPAAVSGGALWVGSIVLGCRRFEEMIRFWTPALGYRPREPRSEGGAVLIEPKGRGPNLSLQRVEEAPPAGYRYHLDLYSSSREAEVGRLIELGAVLREAARPGRDFVTLEDPDGCPFDAVSKPGFELGQLVPRSATASRPTLPPRHRRRARAGPKGELRSRPRGRSIS